MNINVQTKSGLPIYEQIERQIKGMIVSGVLKEGEMLPSIRTLAADSKISVITVKRAYEDLEQEGMIYSVQGKGFYVDNPDLQYMKEWSIGNDIVILWKTIVTVIQMKGQ